MYLTLILLGLACVIAAVVGGGFRLFDIEVPVVKSVHRQVLLAAVGVTILVAAFVIEGEDNPAAARAGLPADCAADLAESAADDDVQGSPQRLPSIKVHDKPSAIAVGRTYAWVAHRDGRVTRIPVDTRARRVDPLPGVRVGSERDGDVAIALGFRSVWVTKSERLPRQGFLAKVDADSGEVDERPFAMPDNVAVGHGAVWITDDNGRLTRLEPDRLRRPRVVRIHGDPHGLWVGDAPCVYVATTDPDGFKVFDADTGKRVLAFNVGGAREIAGGGGALWLTSKVEDKAVIRVDPQRPWKPERISLTVGPTSDALAADEHGVWTADGKGTAVRIDPSRERELRPISLEGGPVNIAIGEESGLVWVVQRESGEITRIQS